MASIHHATYLTWPTYRAGLMQARAYRSLKTNLRKWLSEYQLSMLEWALLGLVYDAGSLRLSELASGLGVEAPLATKLVADLEAREWLTRQADPADGRAKAVSLTETARQKIPVIEKQLRRDMKQVLAGVNPIDLATYMGVMVRIAEHDSK